jgi:hypothetical protein
MDTAFKIPRFPAFEAYITMLAFGAILGDSSRDVSVSGRMVPRSIFMIAR